MQRALRIAPVMVLLLVAAGPGCRRAIGDDCQTSVDCDPNGNRACDLSQPGGYCTIQGCDENSCPDDATCIRSFPEQFLSKPCVPECEDLHCRQGDCPAGDTCDPRCPAACPQMHTDDCAADELCLDVGLCVKRSAEQRFCAKSCGDNGDCRGGYECRLAGTRGSMVLSATPGATTRFCAPHVP